jgi:uncharacterized SAM-binding protein YcdF (DUF218 family)
MQYLTGNNRRDMTRSNNTARRNRLSMPRFVLSMLLLVFVVAASAFVGGFFVFADQVATAKSPSSPRADGIVALTGDTGRIGTAIDLLSHDSAKRLLISGVDEMISAETLRKFFPASTGLFDCCIDIDHAARDTRGNAREARDWARARGYRSLIIVTSAYHMPRSLSELRRALPEVELVPVPVQPVRRDPKAWMRNGSNFRLLLMEYVKYILSRLS